MHYWRSAILGQNKEKKLWFLFLILFVSVISFSIFSFAIKEKVYQCYDLNALGNDKTGVFDVITIFNRKPKKIKSFTLTNPHRAVIDFYDSTLVNFKKMRNDIKSIEYIKRIRYSQTKEKVRVVFDLADSVKKFSYVKTIDIGKKRQAIYFRASYNPSKLKKKSGDIFLSDIINDIIKQEANISSGKKNSTKKSAAKKSQAKKVIKYLKKNKLTIDNPQRNSHNTKTPSIIPVSKKNKIPVIVIDAGHGGKDPGAISKKGTREKDINLAFAKELYNRLRKNKKYKVYLVRNKDIFLKLHERTAIAKKHKADLFISLHSDAAASSKAHGMSFYTISQTAAIQGKQRAMKKDVGLLSNENDYTFDVKKILVDLAQSTVVSRSKRFAEILASSVKPFNITRKEYHKSAGFAVLKLLHTPSVLIELGFLTNKKDEALLLNRYHKKKVVIAMIKSINQYFSEFN